MRSDRLYLTDIIEAAGAVARFLDGMDESDFYESELHQSGVLQKLTIIGEASSRISKELREAYPAVNWRGIVGFRNFAVHEYFAVDWSIVWTAAVKDTPALQEQIQEVLRSEHPA